MTKQIVWGFINCPVCIHAKCCNVIGIFHIAQISYHGQCWSWNKYFIGINYRYIWLWIVKDIHHKGGYVGTIFVFKMVGLHIMWCKRYTDAETKHMLVIATPRYCRDLICPNCCLIKMMSKRCLHAGFNCF